MIIYHINMLTFSKTFHSVRNLKMKNNLPLPSPPSKHTLNITYTSFLIMSKKNKTKEFNRGGQ